MTSTTKSATGISIRSVAYDNFQGLDVSRDVTSLDTGKNQHLSILNNGFCDWRGQIVRDPGAKHVKGDHSVLEVNFYSKRNVVYAEQDGAGVNLVSEDEHTDTGAFPLNSRITSTVFNRGVHFFCEGEPSKIYDGTIYKTNGSPDLDKLRPGFGTSVARRMAVAGVPGRETQIFFSRVDNDQIFPGDEPLDSASVLRAGTIDVANQLGTSEVITGLSKFEQSRLAVFTDDRVLVFLIDPNIDLWALDDKASINVGCVSHKTIVRAGSDILFCSRSGVHSLRRSAENGVTIEGSMLSEKIDILYRELIASVEDVRDITAVYDQDMGQYHIFFPQRGGVLSKRLTMTVNARMDPKWSRGDFLNARSGAFQGGRLVYGTSNGLFDVAKIEDVSEQHPVMEVVSPVLWHGSFTETKNVHSLLVQADGIGEITLECIDDIGRTIGSDVFEVNDRPDDNFYADVPLSRQYERKFEARYRGAQYKLTVTGKGLCRVIGLGVILRK